MRNYLLILLMLILPLQALAAAERNLTHVFGSDGGRSTAFVMKHLSEHAAYVPHHHDDHENDDAGVETPATHVDDSQKSVQHLLDIDQGCHLNILLPALDSIGLPPLACLVPTLGPDTFSDRTTLPLLRPPRAFA